jgi:hypothetical protein
MSVLKQTTGSLLWKINGRRRVVIAGLALVGMAILAVVLLGSSTPTQASEPTDYFTCTPLGVAAFTSRVHVRCSAAAPGGIVYFAVSTADSASSSRFLSVFTTAKVMGKNLGIYYTASDTSGNAWGCNASDCRIAWGAEVLW